jgi:tRNA A-37 threonylcarbamoyl transferase component Bud32
MSKREVHQSMPHPHSPSTRPPASTDSLGIEPCTPSVAQQGSFGEFAPGTSLKNRYVLEKVLGSGGMGEVYLGRDTVLDRCIAVKVIRPRDPGLRNRSLHETSLREAFIEEARIGANLTHPAIATVFDFGFHDGEPFIVFEYIAGEPLREVIRRRSRLPLEEVRLILGPLAQALDFAHSHHVVHRDLKPENIRATAQGHFKILDLGLAKQFRHQLDWSFAGTPAYASPEQAASLPCDGRTDQYALALITHEMLTGHCVFEHADWSELLRMHREQEPLSPHRIVPDLSESVSTALLRALEKDPNQRFATCEEFAVAMGCQFLSLPASLPEILLQAKVRRLLAPWRIFSFFQFLGCGHAALARLILCTGVCAPFTYLVLTPNAIWASCGGELMCWPLQAISVAAMSDDRWGSTLHVRVSGKNGTIRQSLQFSTRSLCQEWYHRVYSLKKDASTLARHPSGEPKVEHIVLLNRRPLVRYQLLGTVEAKSESRKRAEALLQIQAATMGADAVMEVQQESIPEFNRTLKRLTGTAIRAVDQAGRLELRFRWFADQIAKLSSWMFLIIAVSFLSFFPIHRAFENYYLFILNPVSSAPSTRGEELWLAHSSYGEVLALFFALHGWPLATVVLLRLLRWPQLLRPAATSIFFLSTINLIMINFITVDYEAPARIILFFLPFFGIYVARRSRRIRRLYRVLIPDIERQTSLLRLVVGGLFVITSLLFGLLPAVFVFSRL